MNHLWEINTSNGLIIFDHEFWTYSNTSYAHEWRDMQIDKPTKH